MRRAHVLVLSTVMLLGTMLVASGVFATQDTASTDFTGNPFVGSWILDTDPADPANDPVLAQFSSDGGYVDDDQGIGVWEPTGDTTANLTLSYVAGEDDTISTIRASLEMAPDGQSWTAMNTFEITTISTGESSGQMGPVTAEATRMVVEAPSIPAPEGTPGATPAS